MSTESCVICETGGALERVRYYPRQLITASVMTTDQEYVLQKARRHNRCMGEWGVVCGLNVEPNPNPDEPWLVRVCPGCLVDPHGMEIDICQAIGFDVATGTQTSEDPCAGVPPCPPTGNASVGGDDQCAYLVVCHDECLTNPEPVPPLGCGCDPSACEYARIRDSYRLELRFELPQSHVRAAAADEAWCEELKRWARSDVPLPPPVPPCPECPDDPCVVLARICLPATSAEPIGEDRISYDGRRVLYSASALRTFAICTR